jgi:hypothetical protein
MTRDRTDWLDRLALRSLPQPVRDDHRLESEVGEEQFSRNVALKLALTGAAALSLGLGTAPAARAQDRGKCFTDCHDTHEAELERRIQSCNDVFEPRKFKKSDWRLYVGVFHAVFVGAKRDYVLAGASLTGLCILKARWDVGGDKKHCYEGCEATCPRRSVQSSSGRSAATCEVTPPPHAPPTTIPPIPNLTSGVAAACANCTQTGGECCPSDDPNRLCTCASYDPDGPETACQRAGCR